MRLLPALILLTLTACELKVLPAKLLSADDNKDGEALTTAPEGGRQACSAMAVSAIGVKVSIPLFSDSRVSVEISQNDQIEHLESRDSSIGYRIMENGTLKLGHQVYLNGAYEGAGEFVVNFLVNGISQEQRKVTVLSDGCHPIPQQLAFTVTPNTLWDPNPAMDYYPVSDGRLVLIDRQSGVATVSGTTRSYTSTEIIRIVSLETNDGETVSYSIGPEKQPTLPTSLGRFIEKGIDRGALLNPDSKDTGEREIFAR